MKPLVAMLCLLIGCFSTRAALVGSYNFEESESIALDAANPDGTGEPDDSGTLNGNPIRVKSSRGSKALEFDGTDDFVHLGLEQDMLLGATGATLAAWVKVHALPLPWEDEVSTIIHLSRANVYSQSRAFLGVNADGKVEVLARSSEVVDYVTRVSTSELPGDTWVHVAGVIDWEGKSIRIYINGELDLNSPLTEPFVGTKFPLTKSAIATIGSTGAGFEFFLGQIDDVCIFNTALSNREIRQLFKGTPEVKLTLRPLQKTYPAAQKRLNIGGKARGAVKLSVFLNGKEVRVTGVEKWDARLRVRKRGVHRVLVEATDPDGRITRTRARFRVK